MHAGEAWVRSLRSLPASAFGSGSVGVDGNLISSRTPDDLPAFLRAIIERLGA